MLQTIDNSITNIRNCLTPKTFFVNLPTAAERKESNTMLGEHARINKKRLRADEIGMVC